MNRSERVLGVVFVAAVAVIAAAYFWIRPTLASLHSQNVAAAARRADITNLNAELTALKTLSTKLEANKDAVERLGLALPTEDQMPEILSQIEALAARGGVELSALQPVASSEPSVVQLSVSIKGRYSDILKFMVQMENNLRPINLRSLNFVAAKDDSGATLVSGTVGIDFVKLATTKTQGSSPLGLPGGAQ